jgi:hypothetical protein
VVHLEFVIDDAADAESFTAARATVLRAADRLFAAPAPGTAAPHYMGVIPASEPDMACGPTAERASLVTCVESIPWRPEREPDLATALARARAAFARVRDAVAGDEPSNVLVLQTARAALGDCAPIAAESAEAKRSGVLVITLCSGTSCDETCLANIASGPRYQVRASGDVDRILERLLTPSIPPWGLHGRARVALAMGDGVGYVAGSARPRPSTSGALVEWDLPMPGDAITLTLRVRPTRTGRLRTSASTTASVVGSDGRARDVAVPSAVIEVAGELWHALLPTAVLGDPMEYSTAGHVVAAP